MDPFMGAGIFGIAELKTKPHALPAIGNNPHPCNTKKMNVDG
jgi:hypothetical protein